MAVKASGIITLARVDNGSTGPAGVGVSSITGEFYLSTSKTAQSGGSWVTTPPAWSSGKYLWTRYKIVYTNGSTAYTSPQCSSEWEAINELQIGSANLLDGTKDFNSKYWGNLSYVKSDTDGFNYVELNDGWNQYIGSVIGIKQGTYTISFYAKCETNQTIEFKNNAANAPFFTKLIDSRDWKKYVVTINVASDTTSVAILTRQNTNIVYLKKINWVEGNVEKVWGPSLKDTQDQIDQANENISNKVDQGAYDTDQATIWGSINSKMDDAEFREYKSVMDALKSSYDAFVGEGGRFEQELQNATAREQAIVQNLGAQVQQLNFINTYIRESEEGLLIGSKGSPMQMLLSKDSLAFMDGGQTVAYFSNQSFYINRGAVVESLQVGVHKLTKIDNYHTVIQYIPN